MNTLFNVCIMNPPYNRTLHVKFLNKVVRISTKTVSIQPISFIQKAALYGTVIDGIHFDSIEVISVNDTINYFDAKIRDELGIITANEGSSDCSLRNMRLFADDENIIYKCVEYAKSHDTLYSHLDRTPLDGDTLSLKFTDGAPLYGHGKISFSTFRLCPMDFMLSCSKEKTSKVKYLNDIPSHDVRKNIWEFYNSVFMRYWYWKCCLAHSDYKHIPFLGYDRFVHKWDVDDYRRFFIDEIGLSSAEWSHYYNKAIKLPTRQ